MPHSDITLPLWPIAAICPLLGEITQAWLVGGAVRDLISGRRPHDWDFVVTGSGLSIARAVANKLDGAYYALDAERQTGRAIVTDPASNLRVTLDFAALRHPTIVEDLLARDFTLNAMAASLNGQVIDPSGGYDDLVKHSLRMVRPSCFRADSVRLLRAVRLATQFDLALEDATRAQIEDEASAITDATPERVRAELVALVALPNAATGLALLVELGLAHPTLPEFGPAVGPATEHLPSGSGEVARRIEVVAALIRQQASLEPCCIESQSHASLARALADASPAALDALNAYLSERVGPETTRSVLIRWAALFAPPTLSPNQETGMLPAERRLSALRFSEAATDFVGRILESRRAFDDLVACGTLTGSEAVYDTPARRAVFKYYRDAREGGVAAALLGLATHEVQGTHWTTESWSAHVGTARMLIQAYFTQRGTYVDPLPLLSGHDLLALGVTPGPPVGAAVALLREAQATGEVNTQAQARDLVLQVLRCAEGDRAQVQGGSV